MLTPAMEGVGNMKHERILIVGTGAMACFFAARLAPHVDVTLLGTWEAGIKALQEHGVRLVEKDGSEKHLRGECDKGSI